MIHDTNGQFLLGALERVELFPSVPQLSENFETPLLLGNPSLHIGAWVFKLLLIRSRWGYLTASCHPGTYGKHLIPANL